MASDDDDYLDYNCDPDGSDVVDAYVASRNEPPPALPEIRVQEVASRRAPPSNDERPFGRVFTDHMAMLDWDERAGWTDPRVVPFEPFTLHPASALFHNGQAITEDLKAFRGADRKVRLFRPDLHCRAFTEGAARLCLPEIDRRLMRALIERLVALDRDWLPASRGGALYLRSTLIATEPTLAPHPARRCLFFVVASPGVMIEAVTLLSLRVWIDEGTDRAAKLRADYEARVRGYGRALLTDRRGHVEDLGTMTLIAFLGDEVVTPALGGGVHDSPMRETVLALCRIWGLRTNERPLTVDEIVEAARTGRLRELFGCDTRSTIRPIEELGWRDERIVINGGKTGELAQRLFYAITEIQYGYASAPPDWVTPVD